MTKASPATIKIVSVPINELNSAPYNPREWSDKQTDQLRISIERFGFVDPILVNGAGERKNVVIGGHFRLKVAQEIGLKTVPVVYLDIPDIEQEKELNLRLNRNTGSWNYDLLKEMDISLLLDTGFDDTDLSIIWDEALGLEDDAFKTSKEIESITESETKEGDLYKLGRHRLICGDSTDPKVLERLLGDNKLDMIYSDPPYNLNYDYQRGLGDKQKYKCKAVKDNRSYEDYQKFLATTLSNGLKHCHKDAHIFYWCDQKYIGLLQDLYRFMKIDNKRICLWIKNNQNATPNVAFNKCYEPCVYGTIGKPYLSAKSSNFTEILNPEIETGNRTIDDILDLLDIWLVKRLHTTEYLHPTEKPVTLHEKPLKRCTKAGDHVLDLFGGSGSTLIACEQLGRTAFIVEKDPIFCDVIKKRYIALNPQNNVHKIN
jgi:DNA modification methylase